MVAALVTTTERMLRAEGRFGPDARGVPVAALAAFVGVGGAVQGAVMGSHAGQPMQSVISATKVPLLLLASTVLALPPLYAVQLARGLGDDFLQICRATLVVQATAAVFLASCAPLIAFAYLCSDDYPSATFVNGLAYLGAAWVARDSLRRQLASLIERQPQHRWTLRIWSMLYVLVAIQLAWTLRPFVGWPEVEPTLFREEAWGNAYVQLFEALRKLIQ